MEEGIIMKTLTQLFYSKLCGSPEGYLQSTNGRNTIAKMSKLIKQKEGRLECKYFLNLLIVKNVVNFSIRS